MKKLFTYFLFFSFFYIPTSAQFVFDSHTPSEEKTAVIPPLENQLIPLKEYKIQADQPSTIQHPSGTKIIVPANAFVDSDGNIVKGEVDLKFREFNNPLDIYLSGIPMTTDHNGKKEVFQSAGMVELRVSQNNQEVYPNPDGELINIELTSNQLEDDFQLYNLDESTGEWIEEGKDEVLWNSKNITEEPSTKLTPNNNVDSPFFPAKTIVPPVCPSMRLARFDFIKLKRDRDKEFRKYFRKIKKHKAEFQFKIMPQKYSKRKNRKSKHLIKTFPEFEVFKNVAWIYDGEEKRKVAKFLFELNRTYHKKSTNKNVISQFSLEDISIHPNLQNDNYDIQFSFKDTTVIISAFPYFSTSNPISMQKKHKDFYKKYTRKYNQRCKDWKELEVAHKSLMETYSKELAEFQIKLIEGDLLANLSATQIRNGVTRRRFRAFTFGILNIDKVMARFDQEVFVEFINEKGLKVDYEQIVILDQKNNAMLGYDVGEKLRFDSSSDNSLIITLNENEKAIVDAENFKLAYQQFKKGRIIIPIKSLDLNTLNKKELSNALASN